VSNVDLESTASQPPLTEGVNVTVTHVIVDLDTSTRDLAAITATPGAKLADSVVRASGSGSPMGVQVQPLPPASPSLTALLNDTVVSTGRGGIAIEAVSVAIALLPDPCEGFTAQASLVNVIAFGSGTALETIGRDVPPATCPPPLSMVSAAHSNYNGVRALNGQVSNGGHNQTSLGLTNPAAIFLNFPINLHERPGAPTINAGSSIGLEATDLDGNPRIIGPAADIGAYEFRPRRAQPRSSASPSSRLFTGL
jgi:hypothetical protein